MLGRDLLAIFILGRVVGDGAVHAGNLQSHISPAGSDLDPLSRQRLTLLFPPPHAQRAGLGENNLGQPGRVFRLRQHRQQHSRTVLLHLHRHGKSIERAVFEQALDHVAENLRIQIVEIGFEHRRWFPAKCSAANSACDSPMVKRSTFGMSGKIAGARAVARFLDRHRRKRREAFGQRLHDRRARRRDQFHLNARRNKPARPSTTPPWLEPAPEELRARTSPFRRRHSTASRQSHPLPAPRLRRRRRRYPPSRPRRRLRESERFSMSLL